MGTFRQAALAVGLLLAAAPAAMAQSQPELRIAARTDGGGASPACMMPVRLTNTGSSRISTLLAEVDAVDVRTGTALRLPMTTVAFMGVNPGETKEWTTLSAVGAPCDRVRLRVRSVACSRRCGEARWMQQGLAGLDVGPQ